MKRFLPIAAAVVLGGMVGTTVTLAIPLSGGGERVAGDRYRPDRSSPALSRAPIPTLLAWTTGGLPEGYPQAVRRLRAVRAAAVVRSGTAWLTSWSAPGEPTRGAPSGMSIPLELAAIHPDGYLPFVPPADRGAFGALEGGGALLGSTAARIRGVGAGARLAFGDAVLEVEGVVDDELIGGHEVAVSIATGRLLGIERPRYLLVEPRPRATLRRVETALRHAAPPGARLRVRGPGETPVFRHGDAVLAPVRLKELFGEFAAAPAPGGWLTLDPSWVRANIRTVRVPILGDVTCHQGVIPQVRGALEELVRRGLGGLIDPAHFGGCYGPRFINRVPGAGISHHAWGVALDLNVAQNPYGSEPTMDPRVVDVFERWGLTWGGRFLVPDGMHFEFLRYPLSPGA